ncbi:probable cytochrome P450 313a4 [Uranotaenia lowii]|uniref:probable cytochrome P450 313a4 n=1 Tax=Uranotaenia lowii TaxID=190385 RepID=UPI00247AC32D|nr:probable cytochrome P450 313a4 [Uranotaenia lowii]
MWWLWLVLTSTVSILSAVIYWWYRVRYAFADKWPTMESTYPLVGNGPVMMGKSDTERFEIIKQTYASTDRIRKAWAGPKLLLLVTHPDLVQQLLTDPICLEKPFLYRFAGFEQGLFTAKYHTWKTMRKRLNPCFNIKIIHGFIPILARCGIKMGRRLNEFPDGTVVNIHKFTALCTLEMACGTTLGRNVLDRDQKRKLEFEHGLDTAFRIASHRMITIQYYSDFVFRLSKLHKELQDARKAVVDFFLDLVNERRQSLQKPKLIDSNNNIETNNNTKHVNNNLEDSGEDLVRKPKILVDQLLMGSSDGTPFSDQEITDNIYAVISGAVDTSGLITAHACLFLSFYPEVQKRLFAEINEHYPADCTDPDFSPETLKQLEYTEMFLNEVQRLWTVVPYVARENTAEIEIDGIKVPPGNVFVMSLFAVHRRTDIWGPNAEQFDPENFSKERMRDRHPFAFLPFSGGNRICVGWRYAQFALKIIMINLVRNFEFNSKIKPEDIRFLHDLTLKLPFEHAVKLTKRNPAAWS